MAFDSSFNLLIADSQGILRLNPDGTLVRFADLPEALAAGVDGHGIDEWRVHFHVPVFAARLGDCTTTQPQLEEMLDAIAMRRLRRTMFNRPPPTSLALVLPSASPDGEAATGERNGRDAERDRQP